MSEPGAAAWGFARRFTPLLRLLVEQYERTLPMPEFLSFLDFLRGRFESDTAALRATPAGSARARLLHELLDAEMAQLLGETQITLCPRLQRLLSP
jgi:hypothetical protein